MSTENPPAVNQGETSSTIGAWSPETNGIRRENAASVARATEPTPAAVVKPLPRRVPSRPQAAKPASGRAQTIHRDIRASPFQQVDLVDVDRLGVPEERHEDGQADGGFGGRDGDHEE